MILYPARPYDLTTGVRKIATPTSVATPWSASGLLHPGTASGKKFSVRLARNEPIRQIAFINGDENRSLSLRLNEDLTLNYCNSFLDIDLRGALGYYNATNSLTSVNTTATKDYSAHRLEHEPHLP